jgi:hypothetical protein
MAKRRLLTEAAGEVHDRSREDLPRLSAALGELVRRTEQVPEPGSDSPRLKTSPHGYLVIAATGDVLTPEMVKEASEDPPPSPVVEVIREMADDQFRLDMMTQVERDAIILRHPGPQKPAPERAPRKKHPNRITEALLETAEGMHRIGVMDAATYEEITLRHLGPKAPTPRKAPTKKVPNRAVEAILEMADDQLSSGLITQAEHDKITNRHLLPPAPGVAKPSSSGVNGTRIRKKL